MNGKDMQYRETLGKNMQFPSSPTMSHMLYRHIYIYHRRSPPPTLPHHAGKWHRGMVFARRVPRARSQLEILVDKLHMKTFITFVTVVGREEEGVLLILYFIFSCGWETINNRRRCILGKVYS